MTQWLAAAKAWKHAADKTDNTEKTVSPHGHSCPQEAVPLPEVLSDLSVLSGGHRQEGSASPFISADGHPVTWTGRAVHPDEWSRLSEWERFGSRGKIWNAMTRQWEPATS